MTKQLSQLFLIVAFLGVTMAETEAQAQRSRSERAQSLRAEDTFFLRPRLGISTYGGDRDADIGEDFWKLQVGEHFSKANFSFGLELGYAFSPYLSLGLNWQLAKYTEILGNYPVNLNPLNLDDSSQIRHSPSLLLRWEPLAHNRLTPFGEIGANLSFGKIGLAGQDAETRFGFGPVVGFGLDYMITDRIGLGVESLAHYVFDDEAADLQNPGVEGDETDFDLLGYYGISLQYNFKSACVPVELLTVEAPDSLALGTPATFTATVNPQASQDVEYVWDLGDGTTREGLTITHEYETVGAYNATLSATNCGGTDTRGLGWGTENSALGPDAEARGFDPVSGGRPIVVFDPCPAPAEVVAVATDPPDPIINETITFSANVRGTEPYTYSWDFGDGTTSTDARPRHTYAEPGDYMVKVEVTNCGGSTVSEMSLPVTERRCSEIDELNTVFFDSNSSELDDEAKALLDENIAILKDCPEMNVRIDGWSSRGERRPVGLSEDRAEAVEAYYTANGISPDRLTTRGLGRDPAAGKGKDASSRRNRRADSVIVR